MKRITFLLAIMVVVALGALLALGTRAAFAQGTQGNPMALDQSQMTGAGQMLCGRGNGPCHNDADGDGVCDGPCHNDTDGDGVCDGPCHNDADGDGVCDGPCRNDADGDGVCDGTGPGTGAGHGRGPRR